MKMKLTFPKVGTWSPLGLLKTQSLIVGVKTPFIELFFILFERLKFRCQTWPRMSHLGICNTSYGRKKGQESDCQFDSQPLKSQESTRSRYVQVDCNTPLEISLGELQVCFRLHPNPRFELGVMTSQSFGSLIHDNFGTPPWES